MEKPHGEQENPEVNELFSFVHSEEEDSDLTNMKESVKEKLLWLMLQVDRCSDKEALAALKKGVSTSENLFKSMTGNPRRPLVVAPQNRHPHNKRVETQRRFFFTKKKVKRCGRIKYAKPSREEKDGIFENKGKLPTINLSSSRAQKALQNVMKAITYISLSILFSSCLATFLSDFLIKMTIGPVMAVEGQGKWT